jgi:uncharacterized protein (DUF305 family)
MLLAATAALAFGGFAVAQQGSGHGGHAMQGQMAPPTTGSSPATAAYEAANMRMHKDMSVVYSGDADVDFARSMIPHHRGAIDMARIVLQHGQDPDLRKLAQEVISTQEKEIAFLQEWLKARGQ